MKKFVYLFVITLLVFSSAVAQERAKVKGSSQSEAQGTAQTSDQSLTLDSGAQLSAELLTTLNAKKAKPGDEFKMRTLKPVVVGGKQAIAKGSLLVGHVIEATQAEGQKGISQLKLGFDQLQNKNLTAPFSATIEQITQATIHNQTQAGDAGGIETSGSATSRAATSGSSSGGGLLGGVTGAVGGVASTTIGAVGNTVGSVTSATQQTAGSVIAASSETLNSTAANARGLISITSGTTAEASGEANGNSTLSLTGRNVKVEKGTVFLLRTDKSLNIAANK